MLTALSHTRIEAWDTCPYYFKAVYLDKVPQVKTAPLLIGGFFHDWAEGYVKHLLKTKQQTDLAHGKTLFESMWEARESNKEHKGLQESKYAELAGIVDNFLNTHVFDPDKVAAIELELAFTADWKQTDWFAKDAFFRMKIDRIDIVDKEFIVSDYKTSWAAESWEQIPNNPQLKRYVLGVSRAFPERFETYKVALDYVRLGYTRAIEVDLEECEKEIPRIEAISRQVERAKSSGKFEATPGMACNYCPVYGSCPAKSEAKPFRGLEGEPEALAALGRLILLDRERRELTDGLKVYTQAHGPLQSGGMQYGPSKREETTYEYDAVVAWMHDHAIANTGVLKVSNEDMKKLVSLLERTSKKGNEAAGAALASLPEPEVIRTAAYLLKKAES